MKLAMKYVFIIFVELALLKSVQNEPLDRANKEGTKTKNEPKQFGIENQLDVNFELIAIENHALQGSRKVDGSQGRNKGIPKTHENSFDRSMGYDSGTLSKLSDRGRVYSTGKKRKVAYKLSQAKKRLRRRRQTAKQAVPGASIHVVPLTNSDQPAFRDFDQHGNINVTWEAKSQTNMKLLKEVSRDAPYFPETYIYVKYTGNYFIYGQIFFHGTNHEMSHCLFVADIFRRCFEKACDDRKALCSKSAPGHPISYKGLAENMNTNYIGGVVFLKKGSTIRLGIDATNNIKTKKPISIDKSLSYFGAFSVA